MGELIHIGEAINSKTCFPPEHYENRKRYWLSTVDERTEHVAGGRIYCNFCGKEKSLDMPDRNFYTKCMCDCERQKEKQEQQRVERQERAKAYRELNDRVLPVEVRNASFYRLVNKNSSAHYLYVCERCEKFCNNFQAVKQSGRGIWLYGEFDTGKTYIAAAILKKLQLDGVLCTFTTMSRILEDLKATYNNSSKLTEQGVMANYSNAECLILDNFTGIKQGRQKAENWAADRFCEIITRRYEQHLPTVITSRSSIKELVTDGLLPREIVDKLFNKMVELKLLDNQRRSTQQAIEF